MKLRGGNGIVETRDGRSLLVSAWSGGEIVRIRRDGRGAPKSVKLDYLPDNLRWAPDGSLLVGAVQGNVPQQGADWMSYKNPYAGEENDLTNLGAGMSHTGTHVGGTTQRLQPGDVFVVPAGMPHRLSQLDGPIRYVVYRFEPGK